MKEEILNMLSEILQISPEEIGDDADLTKYGIDSLDVADMLIQVENKYNITLDISPKYNTVNKLVAYIESVIK